MKLRLPLCFALATMLSELVSYACGSPLCAQAAGVSPPAPARVPVTVLVLRDGEVSNAEATQISIAARRAISDTPGVRFVDAAEQVTSHEPSAGVQAATEDLEALIAELRGGHARDAERRAARIIEAFESDLLAVRRAQLVDAYMAQAVTVCREDHARRCTQGFERVLTFREESTYDAERFPVEYQVQFDATRERLLAEPRTALTVTSEPAGAEVFVDGRSAGPSPAVATELLAGDHYVTVKLFGYERAIERVTVDSRGDSEVSIVLDHARDALLLDQSFAAIESTLGEERTPAALLSLATSRLFVSQALVVRATRTAGQELLVDYFVYDCRTRFLLAHRRSTFPSGEGMGDELLALVTDLYRGVDLRGSVAAPPDQIIVEPAPPIWKRWWFWTAIGAVVASGIVAAIVLDRPASVPDGWTRFSGQLP